jgi:amino acid transporter
LRWKAKRPRFSQGEPPTITTIENATPLTLPRTTRNGVPIYSVLAVLAISLLAFLQVSNGSATVLSWFVNLITASQLINYSVTCATFLCWRRALRAQNINRDSLPYKAIMQPGAAYLGMICTMVMAFVGGYPVFLPGQWDVPTFLFSYFMIGMFPILFFGWRLLKGNQAKWRKPEEVDLKGEVAEIDEYTRNYVPTPPR